MIPNPWLLLGAVGIWLLTGLGSFLAGDHYSSLSHEKAEAVQAVQGQKLLADAQAKIAAQVQANAELNNQIEADHATAQSVIENASAAYADAVSKRVRTKSTACAVDPGSAKAGNSSGDQVVDTAGIFVSEPTLRSLGLLAQSADETVAAMVACKAWAESVGR